jgi:hypothetical protein
MYLLIESLENLALFPYAEYFDPSEYLSQSLYPEGNPSGMPRQKLKVIHNLMKGNISSLEIKMRWVN